ncbi:hypothetical protein ACFQS3_22930 [Glycomyces mayteni]|uniref:Uncharacterized protein n=1 Tax=Glycomyces mayteni TaxID=543887 RepID=A0ABW2DCF4_9ACTN
MWWWLVLSAACAALIAVVQSLAAARVGALTLVRAAIVLAPTGRWADAVFGPIVDRPGLARGLVGHASVPVSLGWFTALAAAPVVGNTTALTLAHGTGHTASWAQIYPTPGPWLAGAALFALLAAHASTRIALGMHLRAWGIVSRTRWWWRAAALAGAVAFAWVWRSVTGADGPAAALALAAGSLALAWTGNRAAWGAYRDMGLAEPLAEAGAERTGAHAIARAATWLLVLAGAALTALVRGLDMGAYGNGPALALLTPVLVLAATVVKDLAGDAGEALARRHGLPFRRED